MMINTLAVMVAALIKPFGKRSLNNIEMAAKISSDSALLPSFTTMILLNFAFIISATSSISFDADCKPE